MVGTRLLRSTAGQLRSAVEVARHVHDGGGASRTLVRSLGDDTAEGAAERFLDRWSNGMGLIVEDAGKLVEMLGQAADAYEAVDRRIAESCS